MANTSESRLKVPAISIGNVICHPDHGRYCSIPFAICKPPSSSEAGTSFEEERENGGFIEEMRD
jgi:hypothetical protein